MDIKCKWIHFFAYLRSATSVKPPTVSQRIFTTDLGLNCFLNKLAKNFHIFILRFAINLCIYNTGLIVQFYWKLSYVAPFKKGKEKWESAVKSTQLISKYNNRAFIFRAVHSNNIVCLCWLWFVADLMICLHSVHFFSLFLSPSSRFHEVMSLVRCNCKSSTIGIHLPSFCFFFFNYDDFV